MDTHGTCLPLFHLDLLYFTLPLHNCPAYLNLMGLVRHLGGNSIAPSQPHAGDNRDMQPFRVLEYNSVGGF